MADFTDEIDAILNPSALVPGGLPPLPNQPASFVDEIDAILTPPAPAANMPGVGSGVLAIKDWLTRNPAMALEIAAQTLTTGAGIAGGAVVAGPPGAIAGGAAGNVAGKQIGRRVGQALNLPDAQAPPDLDSIETAIDAGLGAAGPAAGPISRVGARAITGLRRGPFEKAVTSAHNQLGAQANSKLQQILNNMTPDELASTYVGRTPRAAQQLIDETQAMRGMERDNAVLNEIGNATRTTAQRRTETGQRVGGAVTSALAGAAMSPEPIIGALVGAGVRDVVAARIVPALLSHPELGLKFGRWALGVNAKAPGAARTGLAAIVAETALTREERRAVDELSASLGGQTRTDNTTYDPTVDRHRTPDGRFHGGPVRHGDMPDGSHDDDESDDADAR